MEIEMVFDFDVHYRIDWRYEDSVRVCETLWRWGLNPCDEEDRIEVIPVIITDIEDYICSICPDNVPESVFDDILADVCNIWIEEKYEWKGIETNEY